VKGSESEIEPMIFEKHKTDTKVVTKSRIEVRGEERLGRKPQREELGVTTGGGDHHHDGTFNKAHYDGSIMNVALWDRRIKKIRRKGKDGRFP
jgi:hypothetical protein